MSREYQTVILAGLLHDIGKFIQRGEFKGSLKVAGKHPAVSASFIKAKSGAFDKVTDISLLVELVQRHHETTRFPPEPRVQQADSSIRPLAYLVSAADNYSSAEQGEESGEYRDYKTGPLASIFSRLKLTNPTPDVNHYRLRPLNPANSFPESFRQLAPEQTNNYLKDFGRDFDKIISKVNLSDFDCLYTHLLSLLQRYTWCVPSNTQEMAPDISLFDHLRTTSAIAACLYLYHQRENTLNERDVADNRPDKFRLVVGDLSGIQNYIFDIANIGVGGVAKRLRARSFYLNALSEAVSHNLIHEFDLPVVNIVMSSGGKFYVLLPNLPGSFERIEAFQQELDRWSVSQFGGELAVNLAQLAFNGQAFNNFGQVLGEISERLSKRKSAPLKGYLVKSGVWMTDNFKMHAYNGEEGLCQSCNKQIATYIDEHGDKLCENCRRDLLLGTMLPGASYIAYTMTDVPAKYRVSTFHLHGDYSLAVLADAPEADFPGYLICKLNETNIEEIPDHPALPKFMANYIPLAGEEHCTGCPGCKDEKKPAFGEPVYFDCMANRSRGRKMLGYLKADVDHLGSLFVYGLRDNQDDRNSISRIATMSRMLDLFFSGRVDQLLNIRFKFCYTVFSGGDDLLIVGPWNEIVDLAVTVQDDFKKFTGQNKNITISAGIGLLKPGVPVSRSVMSADAALEESKERIIKRETEGRDQLTFLGRTMKWSKVAPLLETANQLSSWLDSEKLTVGFLRKLLNLSKMHRCYYEHEEVRGLKYLPLLTYEIARNLAPPGTRDTDAQAVRLWAENIKNLDHDHTVYLDFLVKYALLTKE
ncbi:type III-A CRISPR-associated protein Cas10/Csm1 [Pelotomaculum isophthalicicum JI]|uniref:CRISPR system single-strand-specific deoxyribonuclease Cas10/Csm1 (subtype III-A) n=1 Tax=Pelotomaculum isophthalicicum JI TaxID=947010 RepID=A0A9X4GZF6_9FIRM|nr:type III-A CRISPR-associated protein Cas10/Csm1 [Pelotomaculum isophthalicicum]MDF9408707.1 type III-A CRISPR-associated protein Cas10/Csm1 [Pelotomaculum isophthalicicum JI]